jgi:hypothetical protein
VGTDSGFRERRDGPGRFEGKGRRIQVQNRDRIKRTIDSVSVPTSRGIDDRANLSRIGGRPANTPGLARAGVVLMNAGNVEIVAGQCGNFGDVDGIPASENLVYVTEINLLIYSPNTSAKGE